MVVLSVVWCVGETEEPGAVEAERARLPTATKGGGVPAVPTFARSATVNAAFDAL